jgi:hypothetical protein
MLPVHLHDTERDTPKQLLGHPPLPHIAPGQTCKPPTPLEPWHLTPPRTCSTTVPTYWPHCLLPVDPTHTCLLSAWHPLPLPAPPGVTTAVCRQCQESHPVSPPAAVHSSSSHNTQQEQQQKQQQNHRSIARQTRNQILQCSTGTNTLSYCLHSNRLPLPGAAGFPAVMCHHLTTPTMLHRATLTPPQKPPREGWQPWHFPQFWRSWPFPMPPQHTMPHHTTHHDTRTFHKQVHVFTHCPHPHTLFLLTSCYHTPCGHCLPVQTTPPTMQ